MRGITLASFIFALVPTLAVATPIRTAQYGVVPAREYSERQDQCHLMYYNYCSGWVHPWEVYCNSGFQHPSTRYGTCFDLSDCPDQCRNLEDVWWACETNFRYSYVDVEIYCADESSCPLGTPLAGIYNCLLTYFYPWQHFEFGGLPLCECEDAGGRFIVMISYTGIYVIRPYSDLNWRNVEAGCESEWRCSGHSFVYRNAVSYCDVYGAPGPLWGSGAGWGCTNYPTVPPGCHNYYHDTGHYCEWLIDCYISCQGPTATEDVSWSEIKALYR